MCPSGKGFNNWLKPTRAHLELELSTALSHGLGSVGSHQGMDVKVTAPQYLLLQDTLENYRQGPKA